MTSLYEISNRFLTVLDMANDEDVPMEVLADTLDGIESEFKEKAIAVAGYFQQLDADIAAMKEAESRIAARRKSAERHSEQLRAYLLEKMQETGIHKVECPYFSISIAKCPPSVEITSLDEIPEEFFRVETKITPDKKAIKEAGGCPGATLVTDKKRLVVK